MKFTKIGLSLGGGGGKGAYQTGVLKALHDYGFDDDIKVIAGTSIGSLNIAVFGENVHKGEQMWNELSRKNVFTLNKEFNHNKLGLYSREGMEKILTEHIDLDELSKRESPKMFVTATNKRTRKEEIFQLNGKTKEQIISYLEASSAIPLVFVPAEIDGELYEDGGLKENLPMKVLLEQEKCDLIFMIPVVGVHLPDENTYPDTTIVDFHDLECEEVDIWNGMLGFSAKLACVRMDAGYVAGKAMLTHLIKIGLLPPRNSNVAPDPKSLPATYKRYYSLKDLPEYSQEFANPKVSKTLKIRQKIMSKIIK